MTLKLMDTPDTLILERAMDVSMVRSELLQNNIANVNTPNFKRSDVDFAAIFAETLAQNDLPMVKTNARHFRGMTSDQSVPRIITDTATSSRYDENNVDVEAEMAQITENSIYYQSLSALWKKEMNKLKMVIQGR
jgi:flagellar basal-body rod protein FlgB